MLLAYQTILENQMCIDQDVLHQQRKVHKLDVVTKLTMVTYQQCAINLTGI